MGTEPLTPVPGAPTPERLWQLANYDPLFYVGLMAKYGYTVSAWLAIDEPPPQPPPRNVMRQRPPAPQPGGGGWSNFENKRAPSF